MSDCKREIQEIQEQRRRRLEAQLENTNREDRLLRQETKDLQGATEGMRDLKDKILAQQLNSSQLDSSTAQQSSGDSNSGISYGFTSQ
jgi:hypothetical protein